MLRWSFFRYSLLAYIVFFNDFCTDGVGGLLWLSLSFQKTGLAFPFSLVRGMGWDGWDGIKEGVVIDKKERRRKEREKEGKKEEGRKEGRKKTHTHAMDYWEEGGNMDGWAGRIDIGGRDVSRRYR